MKTPLPELIDGLLIKVILREASEDETRQVEQWVSSGEANRLYFEHFKKIWNESSQLAVHSTVNEDEAWTRFRERVSSPVVPMPRRATYPWLRIAAVFLVLAIGSWLYYTYSNRPGAPLTLRSGDGPLTDSLPDGTVVTLNRNSSLTAQGSFEKGVRAVELEGEAFFNVATDKDRPFTVRAKGAIIHVLGTSFNVRTSAEATEVIVESGLVEVGKDQHFVSVRPHERALVSENAVMPRKQSNPDELYNYYRTHTFVCNNTPLDRLVEVLNNAYNAHIVIADDGLGKLPLTTTFRDESLNEIVEIVAKTLKIKVERSGDQILLK